METMKGIFVGICWLLLLPACVPAQKVEKGWAFSKAQLSGINPQNAEGPPAPPIDTLHLVYLETKGGNAPVIDSVFLNGRLMSAGIDMVPTGMVALGRNKLDGSPFVLQAAAGHSL